MSGADIAGNVLGVELEPLASWQLAELAAECFGELSGRFPKHLGTLRELRFHMDSEIGANLANNLAVRLK